MNILGGFQTRGDRMDNQTHILQKPLLRTALLLAILMLTVMACSFGGVTLQGNQALIDISLTQNQVNQIFANVTTETDSNSMFLKKVTGVELHSGFIRVLGTYDKSDGTEANGSYDVALSAQNDALKAQITAVNVEGVSMNDPRIANANQQMSRALSEAVSEANGEVMFKEVNVTEGALKMKVQVNFQGTAKP
jgi:hypothetical protein